MKTFRSISRPFALRALLLLALVTPVAWVYANAPITDKITGRAAMRHYFSNQGTNAQMAVNKGYYAIINMTYGGASLMKDQKLSQGPRRSSFGGITTIPLDWFQEIKVKVEVYRESTNEKIDTFNWSGKLDYEPGISFHYRCKEPPGETAWPVDMAFRFYYERGTDPAAGHVNVFVK